MWSKSSAWARADRGLFKAREASETRRGSQTMHRPRSKFALLAAAALPLAFLALIAWQWSASSSVASVTAAIPNASASLEQNDAAIQELAPLPGPSEPAAEDRREPASPRVAVEHTAAVVQSFAVVVLKGAIESDRRDLQLARLRVWASWREGDVTPVLGEIAEHGGFRETPDLYRYLETYARADGNFEVDVTRLLQSPTRKGVARNLIVTVEHPHLALATEKVKLGLGERVYREGWIEINALIHMPNSRATLLGQAWTADGAAVTIEVAAVSSAGDDREEFDKGGAKVKKDHSFTLDVEVPGEFAVVALADGYRPSTRLVKVTEPGEISVAPLVLDHGHTISGRVQLGPRSAFTGATIAAQPAGSFTRVQVAGKSLASFDDGFEWASRSTHVDASGYYELSELGPRAYAVSTSGVQGAYLGRVKSREFTAPCSGADLTLGAVREVHVTFHGPGQPTRTRFGVSQRFANGGGGYGGQETAADGRVTLFIEPGTTTSIEVADRAFPVPACAAGGVVEMRVDL